MTWETFISNNGGEIEHVENVPSREAKYAPVPRNLDLSLRLYLQSQFPNGLYQHQVNAIDAVVNEQRNLCISTATASGKTLSFLIPVLNTLIHDKNARALFIYPSRALSTDQIDKIQKIVGHLKRSIIVAKYDGSSNFDERKNAIENASIIITTPDVLHATILRKNLEPSYNTFFCNLKYVILDECHIYDGVFGSNMAYVLRRLRQVCKRLANNPQFLAASATTGDPVEHLHSLTGLEFENINESNNTSQSAGKDIFFIRPKESALSFDKKILVNLCKSKKRFIAFYRGRKEIEFKYNDLIDEEKQMSDMVKPYRAGYEASDRLIIEKGLREGTLQGVLSTSALELGIDLPDMDICLLFGIPETKISFQQRIGRVGRSATRGIVLLIHSGTALDEYTFKNPKWFIHGDFEKPKLNFDNIPLIISHLACAKLEHPDGYESFFDLKIFGSRFIEILENIDGFSYHTDILYHASPHSQVSLRCVGDISLDLRCGKHRDSPMIGTITYSQALREAYIGATYLHLGRRYKVEKISIGSKSIYLDPKCPYSTTTPKRSISIYVRKNGLKGRESHWSLQEKTTVVASQVNLGVTEKVTGYVEKIARQIPEDIDYEKPLFRYFITDGIHIQIQTAKMELPDLRGTTNMLTRLLPIYLGCTSQDIDSACYLSANGGDIYLFDSANGGLGITWPIIEKLSDLMKDALKHIEECSYCNETKSPSGCPACTNNASNRILTGAVSRSGAISLLKKICLCIDTKETAGEASLQQTEKFKNQKQKFGFPLIQPDSVVYTGDSQVGKIISSKPYDGRLGERIYQVILGKQEKMYMGSCLVVMQGSVGKWCINCGKEDILNSDLLCPNCGIAL